MKLTLKELRKSIREEFMRGVPEFALRQASKNMADEVQDHVKRYIFATTTDPVEQREAIEAATETLSELEEEAFELISNKLWQFTRKV